MTTLNARPKSRKTVAMSLKEHATINLAGSVAFKLGSRERLVERVLGAFWNENLFYESGKQLSKGILDDIKAVSEVDPEFVLKLAAFARNEMYLRTTPQVLLVVAANLMAVKPFVRRYAPRIIRRADELMEVVAFQLSQYGKPIPNSLKRGIADSFANFDEFQLNKYDSDKGAVKLADVLRLVDRRKNYPVSEAMRDYLINDKVDAEALPKIAALKELLSRAEPDAELVQRSGITWEAFISKFGSTKENWQAVSANMGYMALLRNLRNFEKFEVDNIEEIAARIANPDNVRKSKQLPFRFYSALKNVKDQVLQSSVAKAFDESISNLALDGRNAIIVDLSGSMEGHLSEKSTTSYKEIAAVLGAVAAKKSPRSVVIGFADSAKQIDVKSYEPLVTGIIRILGTNVGGSTFAHKAFELLGTDEEYDRIIVISDMQCYDESKAQPYRWNTSVNAQWEDYRKKHPKTYLYSLDISAYGTSQFPTWRGNNVVQLWGWSDKLIDFMKNTENKNALLEAISQY